MDAPSNQPGIAGGLSATKRKQTGIVGWRAVRRALAGAVVASVLLGAGVVYSNRPVEVEALMPERDVPVRVFGLGTVEARVMSKVGFEAGAALAELHADHGDHVSKGQVLARLSLGEQEAKVAKAGAALQIAEVNIMRAEANLEKARAVLAQRQVANRRRQELAGRSVVSEQSAEESARDEAVAKADVTVTESEVASSRAQLADARAQVQFEKTLLGHRTLTAPYDAIVIERHKEPGTVVKAGDPIFTLIANDSYWGLAYVDEARAGFIAEGQPVQARLRSRPQDVFTGKVARIGLESDRSTEERRIFIRGDNPPARVFLGEQVEFLITAATLAEALLIPEAAVHGYNGHEGTVWTLEDGRLNRRLVRFRHRTEDSRLEIVGGVPERARVVMRVAPDLRVGRRAQVSEGKGP